VTPRERALRALARQVGALAPALASAVLRAAERLTDAVSIAAIETALRRGGVEAVLAEIVTDAQIDAAFAPVRGEIINAVRASAERTTASVLPSVIRRTVPELAFDVLDPRVLTALRELTTPALDVLRRDTRETVRLVARAGIEAGENPRAVARRIRETIGLAPNQVTDIGNFRAALGEIGTSKKALGYQLRDKRYDATLKRLRATGGTLSPQQIDEMTAAYQRRQLASRAETTARTIANSANKSGQDLAIRQAASNGLVEPSRMVKTWWATQDNRTRDAHRDMNAISVPFDEPWQVPGEGEQMYPGAGQYNCRCAQTFRLLPRSRSTATQSAA